MYHVNIPDDYTIRFAGEDILFIRATDGATVRRISDPDERVVW
jgi:hypothetical protein